MIPGARQLDLLRGLGCPSWVLVVPDKVARSCERRGWLRPGPDGLGLRITPAGLRTLAKALEAGRIP